MSERQSCSRISGFHRLSVEERRDKVADFSHMDTDEVEALVSGAPIERLSAFAENVIAGFNLPLGIATNFLIDGKDVLVPMVIEETSVVAAASNAARLVRAGGGFTTEILEDLVIAQVEILGVEDPSAARSAIERERARLIDLANTAQPSLLPFGGGCRDLEVRWLATNGVGSRMVIHLLVDCVDAMGANSVNAMAELVAPVAAELSGGRPGLRILSNLADRRRVKATATVPIDMLPFAGWSGVEVRDQIIAASEFAEADPYRAATHNKGIMNGVDPVLIATGNDWRAEEAGAHAFAARTGKYGPLATWSRSTDGGLTGTIELPYQLGTVGGVTRLHPAAATSLRILDVKGAQGLARVIAAVGLAQNLAALRALATEGINKGHMRLHQRNVALAQGEGEGASTASPTSERP